MVKQRLGEEKNSSLATSHNHIHWLCGNRCFFLASPCSRNTDTPALLVAGICNSVLCQEELCLIHDYALIFCDFPWKLCLCWPFSCLTSGLSNSCCTEWQDWVGSQRPQRPSSPTLHPAVLSDECRADMAVLMTTGEEIGLYLITQNKRAIFASVYCSQKVLTWLEFLSV